MSPLTEDDPSISFKPSDEDQSWYESKLFIIESDVPEEITPLLLARLEPLANKIDISDLDKRNIDILLEQAAKLENKLHMFQQQGISKADMGLFWTSFSLDDLEPNRLQEILQNLDKQIEKQEHSQETSEKIDEILPKELEVQADELKEYYPYYFTAEERQQLYKDRQSITDEKALVKFKQQLNNERIKRERFVAKKVSLIKRNLNNVAFCQRQRQLLEEKYGTAIFSLASVEEATKNLPRIEELQRKRRDIHQENEALALQEKHIVQELGELTGMQQPVITTIPTNTPQAANESIESHEVQLKALRQTKRIWEKAMKFWNDIDPQYAESHNHAKRGGNKTMAILDEVNGRNGVPTRDQYTKMEESAETSQKRTKDGTEGLFRYRIIDVPSDAALFDTAQAQALETKTTEWAKSPEMLVNITLLGYIDAEKRGSTTKADAPNMREFLAHINKMIDFFESK